MFVDGAALVVFNHLYPNPCTNRRTVRFTTDKLNGDPTIAETRVFIQRILKPIACEGATHLLENVLVAVVVEVRKHDRVALLEMTEPSGRGDVRKVLAFSIVVHHVRHQATIILVTGTEVEIEVAIVVHVTEVAPIGAFGRLRFRSTATSSKPPCPSPR